MATNSQLNDKGWKEVVESFHVVHVWRAWFAERYGELKELRHRSNPHDPPDLDLVFENGQIGLEHTALKPYPLGHAGAIAKEVNPTDCRGIPSISPNWTRAELETVAFWRNASRSNMTDDCYAALESLASTVRRKLKEPLSDIICVMDEASFGVMGSKWLASQLWQLVNSKEFERFGDRAVILHHRYTDMQLFSAVVRRGEPLQVVS